jgi:hypothetical protein
MDGTRNPLKNLHKTKEYLLAKGQPGEIRRNQSHNHPFSAV